MKCLLDLVGKDAAVDSTADTLVITLETIYGSKANPLKVKGLVAGDFIITNVTNSAVLTPLSVTEASGTYTFTFTDLEISAADELTVAVSKNGYDSTVLAAQILTAS